MTQQPLPLDQFEHVRAMVGETIDANAEQAKSEIRALAEHHRRSIGQKLRWDLWRLAR